MKIIKGLDYVLKNSSVSLGKFDGIHRGHRYLLNQVLKQEGCIPTVFTFEIGGENPRIYSQREKDFLLEEMGMAREIIFPFNEETKKLSAQEFIEEILVKKMDTKYICVGDDFRFGRNREGSVDTLRSFQKQAGYRLEVVPRLTYCGEVIGSTRLRSLLDQGKLDDVNYLLDRTYFIQGTVEHGEALGRKLNMPTANLVPEEGKKLPQMGVYATTVEVEGQTYAGMTNIGKKPTVGEFSTGVETYILDFAGNLYGKEIRVNFLKYLRKENCFGSLEELREQLQRDEREVRLFFAQRN